MPPPHVPDVVVIGGGFAGLAAATRLAEHGVRVHVLEHRPTLGGRAMTFRDPVTGEPIDNGQHILAGCYTETLAFLRRIGTSALLHRPSGLAVTVVDERGTRSRLALPPLPPPLDLAAGVLAWEALSLSDRLSLLRLGPALRGHAIPPADQTVREWLEAQGQSSRLCHLFWEPLALAALNQPIDVAGAAAFVAVLRLMFGAVPDAATILLPSVPLAALYVEPAVQYLQRAGSRVDVGSPARLTLAHGRVTGIRVRETWYPATHVISTVPWFAFGALFDEVPPDMAPIVEAAAALGSHPIVTANLWLDRAVLDERFVGLPGRQFQWVFDRGRIVGAGHTHLSLVSSGADAICRAPNDELVALALAELDSAFPTVRGATVRHASIVRERRSTFSVAPGAPRRPAAVSPVRGLTLAGDWTDTGLPATIESAVLSGHRAAAAVLSGRA